MMKIYKVVGISDTVSMEVDVNSMDKAIEIYETIGNNDDYFKGHIMNNVTGELHAYFYKYVEGGGRMVESWVAFE